MSVIKDQTQGTESCVGRAISQLVSTQAKMQELLTDAQVIAILEENERLQRKNEGLERKIGELQGGKRKRKRKN